MLKVGRVEFGADGWECLVYRFVYMYAGGKKQDIYMYIPVSG